MFVRFPLPSIMAIAVAPLPVELVMSTIGGTANRPELVTTKLPRLTPLPVGGTKGCRMLTL